MERVCGFEKDFQKHLSRLPIKQCAVLRPNLPSSRTSTNNLNHHYARTIVRAIVA